jgi:hypothetical protein
MAANLKAIASFMRTAVAGPDGTLRRARKPRRTTAPIQKWQAEIVDAGFHHRDAGNAVAPKACSMAGSRRKTDDRAHRGDPATPTLPEAGPALITKPTGSTSAGVRRSPLQLCRQRAGDMSVTLVWVTDTTRSPWPQWAEPGGVRSVSHAKAPDFPPPSGARGLAPSSARG